MLCLTNFARRHSGLGELGEAAKLDRSAGFKSGDIIRCDSFSHEACGRDFTFWMQRVGYIPTPCWRAGENIAWGTGSYGTVRSIFSAWMHSSGHRENILGSYGQIGIGLRVGGLDGNARRPRLDPAVRPALLSAPRHRRMRACPTPSTSPTATASAPPS